MRLAEERGKFQALEYDAGSFPPESNLITNPSLERLPYEIPRIRPKQVTVYPSHGARIVDPRVETPDGQRVNVLLEGDSYVYRYRVEVTEDGSGVSCGMAINDQHGDAVSLNACSHHDEVIEKVAKGSPSRPYVTGPTLQSADLRIPDCLPVLSHNENRKAKHGQAHCQGEEKATRRADGCSKAPVCEERSGADCNAMFAIHATWPTSLRTPLRV